MVGVNVAFGNPLIFCVASPVFNLVEIALTVIPLRYFGVDHNLSNPKKLPVSLN
jgi:hypothetical protein